MAKITIDNALSERAKQASERAGYSSVDEFVVHLIEQELARLEDDADDRLAAERLRGLGYIE
jgi:hypothetical protein